MKDQIDYSNIDIKDLAGQICEALHQQGISAVLVGGACVSIYSKNQYQSYDLDFVTHEELKQVAIVLMEFGFKKRGRYFVHEKCPFFIDFLNPPIAIGEEPIQKFHKLSTKFGALRLLTPTDCVKDRLAAYFHWNDVQGLEQAIMVASTHETDIDNIALWAKREQCEPKFQEFLSKLNDLSKGHDSREK